MTNFLIHSTAKSSTILIKQMENIMYTPLSVEQSQKIKKYNVDSDYESYQRAHSMIGFKVIKGSKRPFKSTLIVNTCKGVIRNPYTNLWGITFEEDDSIVDVKQVKIYTETV